jgi:putative sporulation protein YtxC
MLLLTVVYEGDGDIINDISEITNFFKAKNIILGISESITGNTHFVKIFCSDEDFNNKVINTFNLYMANALYKIVISEFYNKEMYNFLTDTYFFLKNDELREVEQLSMKALRGEGVIKDESSIYCINRKNNVMDKIVQCIEENNEININGFITFRMKELREDLESIIDKVVEKYMVEKEYSEFIKLLKYFVEIQESKIDEINIIVSKNSNYEIKDSNGKDIMAEFLSDLSESRLSGTANIDDIIISGLITNSPAIIKIHCSENCDNKEMLDTIVNVFTDRVSFCNDCNMCRKVKQKIKV